MKVWTDKAGKKITGKEFMERWKDGMTRVSPLQQIKITLISYTPVFLGILWGIIVTAMSHTWWMFSILIGSLGISAVGAFGTLQRYLLLRKIEKEVNENGVAK
jgi:hypothetical protein